jgi:hypothetical protein
MVQAGWMPGPKRVFSRLIWDRLRLDAAFADLPERQANPLDRIFTARPAPTISATELSHAALEQAREALRRRQQQRREDEWEAKYEARKAAEKKNRPPRK